MTTRLRLTALFVFACILLVSLVFVQRVFVQRSDRVVEKMSFPEEPVAITDVRVGDAQWGKKSVALDAPFQAGDDWARGITVSVKNISAKPIVHLSLELHVETARQPKHSVFVTLAHGRLPLAVDGPPASPQPKAIRPGGVVVLTLPDSHYNVFRSVVEQKGGGRSFGKAELRLGNVLFEDSTLWHSGRTRRFNSEDPREWEENVGAESARASARQPSFLPISFSPAPAAPAPAAQTQCYGEPTGTSVTCTVDYTYDNGETCRTTNQSATAQSTGRYLKRTATAVCSYQGYSCAATKDVTRFDWANDSCPGTSPTPESCSPCQGETGYAEANADCWPDFHWSCTQCGCVRNSPILVDVLGNGFDLTDVENGVRFDFHGEGSDPITLSWTAAGSDDAWLALDRNSNGTIDNGAELFGNITPQTPSGEENGFRALAEYDKPLQGGNSDGVIDQRDGVYNSLRLWQDINHNGVSEPGELHTPRQLGLGTLELEYKESRRVDRHGNQFRYRAKVKDVRGAQLGRWVWDVFLMAGR